MHNWIEISSSALLHNYDVLVAASSPAQVMPVIKSDAYGHGLGLVAQILDQRAPEWLGVNYLDEAEALRSYGQSKKILVVGPSFPEDLERLKAADARFVLANFKVLSQWLAMPNPPLCHIKIDTGMGRQGFSEDDVAKLARLIKESPHGFKYVEAVCTHFSNVEDVLEHEYADRQLACFERAYKILTEAGFNGFSHAASSASALILPVSRFDLVRTGISLYGFWPSKMTRLSYSRSLQDVPVLMPVLSWKTRIAQINHVKAGSFIGYGCTYKAQVALDVAVIPVGYYEGYPRAFSGSQSYVLIKGVRCPVLGRVCMNMMMVDATNVTKASVGDEVVLIGVSGDETLEAEMLASWSETIHYEIVSRLSSAIPRKIVP